MNMIKKEYTIYTILSFFLSFLLIYSVESVLFLFIVVVFCDMVKKKIVGYILTAIDADICDLYCLLRFFYYPCYWFRGDLLHI